MYMIPLLACIPGMVKILGDQGLVAVDLAKHLNYVTEGKFTQILYFFILKLLQMVVVIS